MNVCFLIILFLDKNLSFFNDFIINFGYLNLEVLVKKNKNFIEILRKT